MGLCPVRGDRKEMRLQGLLIATEAVGLTPSITEQLTFEVPGQSRPALPTCVCRNLDSAILMVKAAENGL